MPEQEYGYATWVAARVSVLSSLGNASRRKLPPQDWPTFVASDKNSAPGYLRVSDQKGAAKKKLKIQDSPTL